MTDAEAPGGVQAPQTTPEMEQAPAQALLLPDVLPWDRGADFMDGRPRYSIRGRDPQNSLDRVQAVVYQQREPEFRGGRMVNRWYATVRDTTAEHDWEFGPFRSLKEAKAAAERKFREVSEDVGERYEELSTSPESPSAVDVPQAEIDRVDSLLRGIGLRPWAPDEGGFRVHVAERGPGLLDITYGISRTAAPSEGSAARAAIMRTLEEHGYGVAPTIQGISVTSLARQVSPQPSTPVPAEAPEAPPARPVQGGAGGAGGAGD